MVAAVEAYRARVAILGHYSELLDRPALAAELDLLTSAVDRVVRLGDEALETATSDDDRDELEALIAGRAYS
jgi:hypothetical protein